MSATDHDPREYWDARLDRNWTLQGVGVLALSAGYNRWLYRARARVFNRIVSLLDVDLNGSRVVDVGPGVGFYVQRWQRLGARVTGIDVADSAVRRLREKFPTARFERQDISDLDVSQVGDGYDVVSAFDVFFHIVDDERYQRALHNVFALLRPGGWFVFTENLAKRRAMPMEHFTRRTRDETERAVRAAGFEIVRELPMFVLMIYPFDATAGHWKALWRKSIAPLARSQRWGNVIGAALYPAEVALARRGTRRPSLKILICRKPTSTGPPQHA